MRPAIPWAVAHTPGRIHSHQTGQGESPAPSRLFRALPGHPRALSKIRYHGRWQSNTTVHQLQSVPSSGRPINLQPDHHVGAPTLEKTRRETEPFSIGGGLLSPSVPGRPSDLIHDRCTRPVEGSEDAGWFASRPCTQGLRVPTTLSRPMLRIPRRDMERLGLGALSPYMYGLDISDGDAGRENHACAKVMES